MKVFWRCRTAAIAASLVALTALGGCDGCGGDSPTIPESPEARLEAIASTLPSETGILAAVGDLDEFQRQGDHLQSAADEIAPTSGLVGRTLKSQIGINPLELDALTSSGLAEDGAAALALFDAHPVALAYVDDRQAFEKNLSKRVEDQLGLKGSPETSKSGDLRVKTLQKKGLGQVSWAYDGKLVTVVFPAVLTASDATPRTVTRTLTAIHDTEPEESFTQNADFRSFRKATSAHSAFAFLSTEWYFSDQTMRRLGAPDPSRQNAVYAALRDQLEGLGLVGEAETGRLRARLRIGLADAAAKRFRRVDQTDDHVDWSRLATDQTLFALRSSENFSEGWSYFMENAPKPYRLVARRLLDLPAPFDDFDLEKRVLDQLTGQAGLFFYGIGPNLALGRAAGSPGEALGQMGVVAGAQFDSAEALRKAAEAWAATDDEYVHLRPLEHPDGGSETSIRVLECERPDDSTEASKGSGEASSASKGTASDSDEASDELPPGVAACLDLPLRLYLHEDLLVVASTALSESSMHGYLTESRQDSKPLSNAEGLDLGGDVASRKGISGLYLNFERAESHLGDKLPPLPALRSALDALQELLVSFGGSDSAVQISATMDLKGQGDQKGRGTSDTQQRSEDAGDE